MGVGDIRLLTIKQAATQIKVHPETLRKWLRQGRLKGRRDMLRPGGPLLIEQQDLTAFADEMRGL